MKHDEVLTYISVCRFDVERSFFDCSKSASRSIVLALERFDVFRCAILAASYAARSVWSFN